AVGGRHPVRGTAQNQCLVTSERVPHAELVRHPANLRTYRIVVLDRIQTTHTDLTTIWRKQPRQHEHEGCLARTVGSNQCRDAATLDRKRCSADGNEAAEHADDITSLNNGVTLRFACG